MQDNENLNMQYFQLFYKWKSCVIQAKLIFKCQSIEHKLHLFYHTAVNFQGFTKMSFNTYNIPYKVEVIKTKMLE